MASAAAALSSEVGCLNHQNALSPGGELSKDSECPSEHEDDEELEDDEEEDLDFNPFLKESPSLEASSSLSSENGPDADVAYSGGNNCAAMVSTSLSNSPNQVQDNFVGDSEYGAGILMQARACKTDSQIPLPEVLISQPETETFTEKNNGSSSGPDVVNDVIVGEFCNTAHSKKPIMDSDDEDAICRRTRARYSLASFTLDELETFLQETDDDDDIQNADDEEEYRKFLAAVLRGGDDDPQAVQETEVIDDEDEDNDADFELEIEEALESDVDENIRVETQEHEVAGRRPETRQNKRQKTYAPRKKKLSGESNRPLRPLLPNAPFGAFPRNKLMLDRAPCLPSSAHNSFVNGFTAHQIGQLHCLLHEHAQLLIQVFSLCVLEPSRDHIASQVQGLISEMVHKRDQVLAWRRIPHPSLCFCPPYIHPSVPDELSSNLPSQANFGSSSALNAQGLISSGQVNPFQTTEGSFWVPFVSGPVLSVLDVAPLALVGSYMDDVSTGMSFRSDRFNILGYHYFLSTFIFTICVDLMSAVREYCRRRVEDTCNSPYEKEPLFPLLRYQSISENNGEVSKGILSPASILVPSSSAGNQTSRKTMAGALVERTKSQSVAPVPKIIAKLAQRFLPLFNPALYPHKPPPSQVANRVLFTDAEDELLARGLMDYNTDWKAIQECFLPCKTKHQIFVRQKNRSSSKAPENPIKAVRRMKSSPLTAEEKTRIEEGLKVLKFDWMAIWKFIVPHRDPALLPRQWRIATGTQKSYKGDADKKEKRRLYASKQRKCNPVALARWQTSDKEVFSTNNAGGNNSGDDCIDNEDEAYVHEAFLADWRPGNSSVSSEPPVSRFAGKNPPGLLLSEEGSLVRKQINSCGSGETECETGHTFPASLEHSQPPHTSSHFASAQQNQATSDASLRPSKSLICLPPYRARRTNKARLVKLAPDLPPLNLPPSVRVMSQSAFKSLQGGASTKSAGTDVGFGLAKGNNFPKPPSVAKLGTSNPIIAGQDNHNPVKSSTTHFHPQDSGAPKYRSVVAEKDESDLQMHPLLFQAPEDGQLPYYPLNCSTSASSSFNFFSRNQPQLNLSLFHNPQQANHTVNFLEKSLVYKEKGSSSLGIDFHPLLQRSVDINSGLTTANSAALLSADSEVLRAKRAQHQNSFQAVQTKKHVNSSPVASSNTKTNDLDLDIHLSFTSRKRKAGESRDVTGHNMISSTVSPQDFGTRDTQNTTNSSYHRGGCTSTASTQEGMSNRLDSGAHAVGIFSNDVNRNSANDTRDQSLPDIVMEQEELSDSEEEFGEHVEFECEEMTDSEAEGSDIERVGNLQNEEVADVAVENADFDDLQREVRTHGNSVSHTVGLSEGSSSKFGTTDQEKDLQSSSLSLNLNSYPPDSLHIKPNHALSKSTRGSATSDRCIARSNRSCNITNSQSAIDMPQDPHLDRLAVSPLRKPRKRVQRTDTSLYTGRARKRDASPNTGVTL
ncbi:hypothetical protein RJ640_005613 [Escallonia rubra]|uniref:Homeodomain-like superfamily protein n=1 Tax=Escallonia rubra TaxID=112253 RepID=A0AA88QZ43_9ASTE|nr:hypothetical protein RJ640_005613 [Escallonia rubra]